MKYISQSLRRSYYAGKDGYIYSSDGNSIVRLRSSVQTSGYYYIVSIPTYNGKRKSQRVHRLICTAYHGPAPSSKHTASHIDGNWRNNKPDNLRWESMKQNHARKKEHGTDDSGIRNSRSKITLFTLQRIRKLLESKKLSHREIGEKFELQRGFISKIANGSRYRGQGFD